MTKEAALLRMAALCAKSEQCESDIRIKLLRAGLSSADIDAVTAELKAGRWLDNARYAESVARYKVRFCSWGRNKIKTALFAKQIPSQLISQAIEAIDEDDYSTALEKACAAKARTLDLSVREDAVKLYRHLLSRGFEGGLASEAVKKAIRLRREQNREGKE